MCYIRRFVLKRKPSAKSENSGVKRRQFFSLLPKFSFSLSRKASSQNWPHNEKSVPRFALSTSLLQSLCLRRNRYESVLTNLKFLTITILNEKFLDAVIWDCIQLYRLVLIGAAKREAFFQPEQNCIWDFNVFCFLARKSRWPQ